MSYIGLHLIVKRGDKYVLDYTSCLFWILRFWWICHALLFTIIWFYFHASFTSPFRDEPEVVNVLSSISAVDEYMFNGDKTTLISPCSTLSIVR